VPQADGGEPAPVSDLPPVPPPEPVVKASPTAAPAPASPTFSGLPPAVAALQAEPTPKAKPTRADNGDLKLPEDAPIESDNEVTVELGWNSDAPVGLRYLRRIEDTWISFGVGVGGVTLWGPKLSAIIRFQPSFSSGFFGQVSGGFAQGGAFSQKMTQPGGAQETVQLIRTPARTADLLVGWRFPWAGTFFEASAGYSFNLEGTVLQDSTKTNLVMNWKDIPFPQAGGPAGAVAYGWLF
jgi:hypothetical protein